MSPSQSAFDARLVPPWPGTHECESLAAVTTTFSLPRVTLPIMAALAMVSPWFCLPCRGQDIASFQQMTVTTATGEVVLEDAKGQKRTLKGIESTYGPLTAGIVIRAGEKATVSSGSADLIISNMGSARLEAGSAISVPAINPDKDAPKDQKPKTSLELLKGKMFIKVDAEKLKTEGAKEFRLKTPRSLLAVKGTRFVINAGDKADTVALLDGSVAVREEVSGKFVLLKPNQTADVVAGAEPVLRPFTNEEKTYRDTFEKFECVFSDAEKLKRMWTRSFTLVNGKELPDGKDAQKDLLVTVKSVKVDGIKEEIVRVESKPDRKDPISSSVANAEIKLVLDPPTSAATGVLLKFRPTKSIYEISIRGFFIVGDTLYMFGSQRVFSQLLTPEYKGEWIEQIVPIHPRPRNIYGDDQWHRMLEKGAHSTISIGTDPRLNAVDLKTPIPPFTVDIAPIKVLTHPNK